MDNMLKVGLVGCGWIADGKHIPTILAQADMEIAALCDIVPGRAQETADKYGLHVRCCTDYRELVHEPELDVVYVCTPNPSHCDIACAALAHGKHVFIEKPLACTMEECRKIIALKNEKKLTVSVGFQRRYFPAHQMAKRLVESGELGDIYYAKAHGIRYRGTPGWGEYLSGKNGGGVFIDGTPHSLDTALWLMDNYEVRSIKANIYSNMQAASEGNMWGSVWEDYSVEDSGFALVTMKNGATLYVETAWSINMIGSDMKATLVGTKAGIDMQGGPATTDYIRENCVRFGATCVTELTPVVPVFDEQNPNAIANQMENRDFVRAIRTGCAPTVTAEQAAVVTQIIEGIYRSAKEGKEIVFD